MPDQENAGSSESAQESTPQTANTLGGTDASEISSLRRFREDSSPQRQGSTKEGESSPNTGQGSSDDNREPAIPRDRFDQVNGQKNQFQQENQQLKQQLALMQQYLQAGQQQQSPFQGQAPSGMVGQAPQQPQTSAPGQNLPDFNDPEVQKEWRKKLGDNPIKGMVEMFQALLQKEGAPMLQQAMEQVRSQIEPVQQAYVQQAVSSYAQQRAQQDQSFQQIAPVFQNVVAQAIRERPNLALDGRTLQVLESVARVQAQGQQQFGFGGQQAFGQFPQQPQQQQTPNPPFSERPGGQAPAQGGNQPRQLTGEQKMVARALGVSEAQYAKRLEGLTRNG